VAEKKRFTDLFKVKNLFDSLMGYIDTKVELYKIQFKEEAAKVLVIAVFAIIFSMIGLLLILFLSLFVSEVLNSLFDSRYLGYLIICIFYLLLAVLVYLLRDKISNTIKNMLFDDNDNDQDDE